MLLWPHHNSVFAGHNKLSRNKYSIISRGQNFDLPRSLWCTTPVSDCISKRQMLIHVVWQLCHRVSFIALRHEVRSQYCAILRREQGGRWSDIYSSVQTLFCVVATMVLPFVAFVQPCHTTALLLTSKGGLVRLSGHVTRITGTSWPVSRPRFSPHRNRCLRFGWREGMREKVAITDMQILNCTCVWNLFSHHLGPRCLIAASFGLSRMHLIDQNSGHLNDIFIPI